MLAVFVLIVAVESAGPIKAPPLVLWLSQLIASVYVSQFTSSLRRLTYEDFHGCPERRVCHECFFYVCARPKLLPSFGNSDRGNNQARREGLRRRAGGVAAFRDLWSRFECRVFLNFNELTARNRIADGQPWLDSTYASPSLPPLQAARTSDRRRSTR